ncbi:hypothetical protein [uncultured Streptococcus sp.]|uniref:hypothetical protein n=1 Tax=uncultured Streptococcus sp. TaxID=83427 RepID=UPI002594AAE6|nr:hypothetical protein [uncultured Streptococcus sp.]
MIIFLTKRNLMSLAKYEMSQEMFFCYAESQSISGTTSKVILLIDDKKLIILFLNFFLTKIIDKVCYDREKIENQKIKNGLFLDVIWSFSVGNSKWRFRILRKILLLKNTQGQFIDKISRLTH